jgi:ribosomal protein S18 acetylase RimI-like enzyme
VDVRIRDAVIGDLLGIVRFDRAAGERERGGVFGERLSRSPLCLVAEREQAVVAYVALDYSFYGNGFVSGLIVAEGERRRGLGRMLLRTGAARCETAKLFVTTNQSNDAMQRLLAQLGFEPSGVIHNLDPGDPELVYFLALGDRAAASVDV